MGILGRCTSISCFILRGLGLTFFYLLLLEMDFPCFTEVFFPEIDLFVIDFPLLLLLMFEFLLFVSKLFFIFPLFS